MYQFIALMCLLFIIHLNPVYAQQNIELIGLLEYNDGLNDVWGYTDENGIEYAIVGLFNATSVVSLEDPANPVELFRIDGLSTIWRDMKVWGDYAYVVNEGGEGLLIIDLSDLPEDITSYYWNGEDDDNLKNFHLSTAHNIFIDEKGYAYILGGNEPFDGATILDLNADPVNPPIAGIYNNQYVHDAFVRGDTLWAAEIENGTMSVVDVSNKTNTKVLARFETPGSLSHNCWLSDDGQVLFTTDEIPDGMITSYDVSDLENVEELDRVQSSSGMNVIPHNTCVLGNFILTSYYHDGLTIHDATHPDNLILTVHYDTSPDFEGPGYSGAWGIYPYFSSGNIIVSDGEEGLYVFQLDFQQAAYLEGIVTDKESGLGISGTQIILKDQTMLTQTGFYGDYKTGVATTGTYSIQFIKTGYLPLSIDNILLEQGKLTELDVELEKTNPFGIWGQVIDDETGEGVSGALVNFSYLDYKKIVEADQNGFFVLDTFYLGIYNILTGGWGYETILEQNKFFDEQISSLTIKLSRNYYDDFSLDFKWTVQSDALMGKWERAKPIGTFTQNDLAYNPGADVTGDLGNMCYVTGNGGNEAGFDDVDDGETILRSPKIDLSDYEKPFLSYYRWFACGGGLGAPQDDTLSIYIRNGIETVYLEKVGPQDEYEREWHWVSHNLKEKIEVTDSMYVYFETSDLTNSGHLVEAAIDLFQIVDSAKTTVGETQILMPPVNNGYFVNVSYQSVQKTLKVFIDSYPKENNSPSLYFEMYDVTGKKVLGSTIHSSISTFKLSSLNKGVYFYRLIQGDKFWGKGKVLVH